MRLRLIAAVLLLATAAFGQGLGSGDIRLSPPGSLIFSTALGAPKVCTKLDLSSSGEFALTGGGVCTLSLGANVLQAGNSSVLFTNANRTVTANMVWQGATTFGDGASGNKLVTFDGNGTDQTFGYNGTLTMLTGTGTIASSSGGVGPSGFNLYNGTTLLGYINTDVLGGDANVMKFNNVNNSFLFTSGSATAGPTLTARTSQSAALDYKVATAQKTCPTSGTTCDLTSAIPSAGIVDAVTTKLTTAGNGSCTSFDVGTVADIDAFADNTAVTVNTTTVSFANGNPDAANVSGMRVTAATDIRITCNGGAFSSTAAVFRVSVFYRAGTAPSS